MRTKRIKLAQDQVEALNMAIVAAAREGRYYDTGAGYILGMIDADGTLYTQYVKNGFRDARYVERGYTGETRVAIDAFLARI